jgi:hypothetical protein
MASRSRFHPEGIAKNTSPAGEGHTSVSLPSLVEAGAAAIAAGLPFWWIVHIVFSVGADNLSNDFLNYIEMMDQVLKGDYHWPNLARDSFIGGHFLLLPLLVHMGAARFFQWNTFVELHLGVLMAVLRLALLYNIIAGSIRQPRKVWLLPLLSAFVFSVSQISGFVFADATLPLELTLLGFALGTWGLARHHRRWAALGWMCLGGIVASWSWGAGLGTWPAFLLGLVLLGYRKIAHYIVWLGGALAAYSFHLYFLVLNPTSTSSSRAVVQTWFHFTHMVNILGRPFTNELGGSFGRLPQSEAAAAVGGGFCLAGLLLLVAWRDQTLLSRATPALMLIGHSLLGAWQATLVRINVAPWYTTVAISFWIGLAALGVALWTHRNDEHKAFVRPKVLYWAASAFGVGLLGGVTYLYVTSNLTYEDKDFYLPSRSPASAACLRFYQTAPTYCEQYVFQWGVGRGDLLARLAKPLERHRLSVFAPRQRWTLQGDLVLGRVGMGENAGLPPAIWSPDLTSSPTAWSSYKRLNLILPLPGEVSWVISLPDELRRAVFHSAVAAGLPAESVAGPIEFVIQVDDVGGSRILGRRSLTPDQTDWQAVQVSLDEHLGETITLRLSASTQGEASSGSAAFRYPYIDVFYGDPPAIGQAVPAPQPSNTDLSPFVAQPTPQDYRFDPRNLALWNVTGIESNGQAGAWKIAPGAMLQSGPLDVCLADYRYLYVRMAAAGDIKPRAFQVVLAVDDRANGPRDVSFLVPLLSDESMHTYTYDLNLLQLPPSWRLVSLTFRPSYYGVGAGGNWVSLDELRLIWNGLSGRCAGAEVGSPRLSLRR